MSVFVRGVKVIITPNTIASFLDLPRPDKDPKPSSLSVNEIYHALTDTKDHINHQMDEVISEKDLLPFFQILHLIVAANITPTKDTTELSIKQGQFLYDIVCGVNIDLPNHIFRIIDDSTQSSSLPFGLLITGLLLKRE